MDNTTLWQLSASEAALGVREKRFSSEELTLSHLERLRQCNPRLNAVVEITDELALKQAQSADQNLALGGPLGALHGVPITVKQNVDLTGFANANGVPALADLVAEHDAPVVKNLKAAGAVILGQTNTPEFSMRFVTDNPLHGLTLNPWDPAITCGGSSGGAASAVAAGIGAIAHGNDIGGSLRWPAHCNGLATIKSTQGRIPAYNPSATAERPFMAQTYSTQGPLARCVSDVRAALEVMAQADARDPYWVPAPLHYRDDASPCKVALAKIPGDMDVDQAVVSRLQQAALWLEESGFEVQEVTLPNLDRVWELWSLTAFAEMQQQLKSTMFDMASEEFKTIWNTYASLQAAPDFKRYLAAQAERMTHIRQWSLFLQDFPLILAPVSTARTPGPRADLESQLGAEHLLYKQLRFTTALNTLCLPVATVCAGLAHAQPVGVQIIGSRFREMRCLHAAQIIENKVALDWTSMWQRMP